MLFNGYGDNERRETKHRRRKADQGHSLIKTGTQRRGSDFSFLDLAWCECGKRYTSKSRRAIEAWERHRRQQLEETT